MEVKSNYLFMFEHATVRKNFEVSTPLIYKQYSLDCEFLIYLPYTLCIYVTNKLPMNN